ncbi:MAG TPA: hypothetical protein VE684_13965 [Crenalkalicoccus sp.]|jgi:hypothetical protein|nr:hypothetical protein [Crenalkalicoccus sp.]
MADIFCDALRAPGPEAELEPYGWLIGSWALEVTEFLPDGGTRRRAGEWHFARVLEGRAIQDVWIVPPRGLRGGGEAEYFGTTLRMPDPTGAWHIHYADPVRRFAISMVGRREGAEIVQFGTDAAGNRRRWRFSDITPEAFRWRGEVLAADGSWHCQTDFTARRTG